MAVLPPDIPNIVLSGNFGYYFCSTYGRLFKSIVLCDGNLRQSSGLPTVRYHFGSRASGTEYVFVDDSFYSGTTRLKMKTQVKELGGDVRRTFVLYDGSLNKDHSVTSIVRYYG